MSVRYRYGTVSVLYRILRVGIGIIPIPYLTDAENAKKWIPIGYAHPYFKHFKPFTHNAEFNIEVIQTVVVLKR
ncbi:hypothetical protein Hanom_Chr17g01541361 [Helianthus anomalus]